jgi:HEPN domain-containing protein
MTDFTRAKMHFSLAMLGTLFAMHPFLDREPFRDWGFTYLRLEDWNVPILAEGVELKLFYAYALTSGLLALSVYFYAFALMSERPGARSQRLGNLSYALAIIVPPLYGGLYLSNLLAEEMEVHHLAWLAPAVAFGSGVLWVVLSQVAVVLLRRRLSDRDRLHRLHHLAEQEMIALDRAAELINGHHYDLSVIEAWKALEVRLRRALLLKGYTATIQDHDALLRAARKAGVVGAETGKQVEDVRQAWHTAIGTDPVAPDVAESALRATRAVLGMTSVRDHQRPHALAHH